ncbi:MAG: hypothetical protein JXA52_00900 [Planctomycetes bacterium]|nr:hypothetical protein [Planctomycetota bacterium]
MIINLSRKKQHAARPLLYQATFWNAWGNGLTTMAIIYLLALHYHASDFQMGLLYAAMYISGFAPVFAPLLLNGRETTAIWSKFWLLRTFACFPYLLLPFLPSNTMRVWVLVVAYYTFTIARAFGMSASFSVYKALATPRELPGTMATLVSLVQAGRLAVTILIFAVFGSGWFAKDEPAFILLIGIGIAFNGFTSWLLSRLPKTGYLEEGSLKSMAHAFRQVWQNPVMLKIAMVIACQTGLVICSAYRISYFKNVVEFSNSLVVLIVIAEILGAIISSYAIRIIGHSISPSALILGAQVVLMSFGFLWIFVEALPGWPTGLLWTFVETLPAWPVIPLAILISVPIATCNVATFAVTLQLRTGILPEGREVQTSVVYQVTGVVAAVLTIGVLNLTEGITDLLTLPGIHQYSRQFGLMFILSILTCIIGIRMKPEGLRAVLTDMTLFAPANLKSIYSAYREETRNTQLLRKSGFESENTEDNPSD